MKTLQSKLNYKGLLTRLLRLELSVSLELGPQQDRLHDARLGYLTRVLKNAPATLRRALAATPTVKGTWNYTILQDLRAADQVLPGYLELDLGVAHRSS